jgi:hypothetical protein
MTTSLFRPTTRRLAILALALAAPLAAPRAALAQQPAAPAGPGLVVGTVVETGTGRPLAYAMVQVEGNILPTLTDSAGVFRIQGLTAGVHNLTASQLGYSRLTLPVVVGAGMEPLRFELFPDPIAIEGIKVMSDRFRGRRNSVPVSAQGYDQNRLRMSPTLDLMGFLETDAKLSAALCPGRIQSRGCFNRRGQVVVPQVFLDEAPLPGGMTQLEGYHPSDFYLVEVIGNGLMIRAYTHGFMEQMSRKPRALEPIILR